MKAFQNQRPVAETLAFAFLGAALFTLAGFPAATLVGATLFVTIAALLRRPLGLPNALRNLAFTIIGLMLAAGVTPDFLADMARFPLSLAMLFLTMVAIMAISSLVLKPLFGIDHLTAILATAPGALSYALALADDGTGRIRTVTVLQSLRLLLITVLLPPALALTGHAQGIPGSGGTGIAAVAMPASTSLLLLAAAYGVGGVMLRLKIPAAHLIAGLLVSALAHASGHVAGRPEPTMTMIGFTLAGAVVGSRFAGVSLGELRRLGFAGLIATSLSVALAAVAAFAVAAFLGFPFAEVMVAFAPGGVEGMSAMALALGFDPIFVASHHVFRIIALIFLLPLVVHQARKGRFWKIRR